MSDLLATLQANPDLEHVPEAQLRWLIERGEKLTLQVGEKLFSPNEPSLHLYVVLSGRLRIWFDQNGESREVARWGPGEISGVLPYSRLKVARGHAVALEETRIFSFHRDHFPEMIRDHYELTEALVHKMTNRVRDFTTLQQQNEKLLSLGKLSAGLAHELNNPASALVRAGQELKGHLAYVPDKFKRVLAMQLEAEAIDRVNALMFQKIGQGLQGLSLLQRNEREDDLRDWLEEQGLDPNDDMVDNLVEYGFTEEDLELILEQVSEAELAPVLAWLDQLMTTERLVGEIQEASHRISELVSSVKSYTHMDQRQAQDRQWIDLREGLYHTVNILKHKFRHNQVQLVKEIEPDLPKVFAYPGELNQVWTNLLDNALDAMPQGGTLTLSLQSEGPCVYIRIIDTGSGIPPEVLPNIFDPFYTTKPIGQGTGMGLDVVQKIMTHHRATIEVASQPGHTEFKIWLPVGEGHSSGEIRDS